jgi:4-hydroxybenzoate polyprenyltransferase
MVLTTTQGKSWISRFNAYLQERFPLINGLLFLILYLTSYTYTSFVSSPDAAVLFSIKAVAGFLAVYSFFFRLRVFDEHKDYEKDCINHPQRVLQSGQVTLVQLRNVAVAGTLTEAIIAVWFSWQVLAIWALALGYSLLMAKEFFARKWLEKRLFLYALSHLLIMPLIILWAGQMAIPEGSMPLQVAYLGCLSFLSGLAFEVSRKTKAPAEEVATIQTYSQIWGARQAALVALGVLLLASLIMGAVLHSIQVPYGYYAGIVLLYATCLWMLSGFIRQPTPAGAKKLELGSSLFMLMAYLLIVVAILSQTGLQWSGH